MDENCKKSWSSITLDCVVQAIEALSENDCANLTESVKPSTSVWGKLCRKLGLENKVVNRHWLRGGFLVNDDLKKAASKILERKGMEISSLNPSGAKPYCICRIPEGRIPSLDMIPCEECLEWYHPVCLGVPEKKIKKGILCPSCNSKITKTAWILQTNSTEAVTPENPTSVPEYETHHDTIMTNTNVLSQPPVANLSKTITSCFNITDKEINGEDLESVLQQVPEVNLVKKHFNFKKKARAPDGLSTAMMTDVSTLITNDFTTSCTNGETEIATCCQNQIFEGSVETTSEMGPDACGPSPLLSVSATSIIIPVSPSTFIDLPSSQPPDDGHASASMSALASQCCTADQVEEVANSSALSRDVQTNCSPQNNSANGTQVEPPDVSEIEKCINAKFKVTIPAAVWKEIMPQPSEIESKDPRYNYRLKKGAWSDKFVDAFMHSSPLPEMKACILTFKNGHRINVKNGGLNYLTASAICGRKGSNCSMKYKFYLKTEPDSTKDVKMSVLASGTIRHDKNLSGKRRLSGARRILFKELLINSSPSHLHYKIYSDPATDIEQLELGNQTVAPSIGVLKTAKFEATSSLDYNKNIFIDLIERKDEMEKDEFFKGTKFNGFIQKVGYSPFFVTLFSDKQLQIMHRLLRLDRATCFFLDATGSTCSKLPEEFQQEKTLHYALVVIFPGSENVGLIPIFEFIQNDQSMKGISNSLSMLFTSYRKFLGKTSGGPLIMRMTTDFSKALIGAVLESVGVGTTAQYVAMVWRSLCNHHTISYIHHVCKRHLMECLREKIIGHFKDNEESQHVASLWIHHLLLCTDLWDFCRRVDDIIAIVGTPFVDPEIENRILGMNIATCRDGDPPYNDGILSNIPPFGKLYVASPYSNYVIHRCHDRGVALPQYMYEAVNLDSVDEDDDISCNRNPHFCVGFLEYLIVHIFPYQCMLDNSLLSHMNLPVTHLTNAASESYNAILKTRELKHCLPQKVGRFIKALSEALKGRISKFDIELKRLCLLRGIKLADDHLKASGMEFQKNNKRTRIQDISENDEPETSFEQWGPKKKRRISTISRILDTALECIHVIPQGGSLTYRGTLYEICNTCWADASLQAVHAVFKLDPGLNAYLRKLGESGLKVFSDLVEIFGMVDRRHYGAAKEKLFNDLLDYKFKLCPGATRLDVWDSQETFFYAIRHIYSMKRSYNCNVTTCNVKQDCTIFPLVDLGSIAEGTSEFYFESFKAERRNDYCVGNCGTKSKPLVKFSWGENGPPPFFFVTFAHENQQFQNREAPKLISVLGVKYTLLLQTLRQSSHFFNVLTWRGQEMVYDGLDQTGPKDFLPRGEYDISALWYVEQKL